MKPNESQFEEEYTPEQQAWLDSGPVKADTLKMWLELIQRGKDK